MKLPFIRRPRPDWFAFQWHITDACDQRCRHCYIYASGASPQEMAWADMPRVVEACEEFCRINDRSPVYYLTGGDPLLHPRFWQLMELLHGRRAPVVILGNPFHLTILPNGDVYACRRVAGSRVGSVLTQSLADLWADGMSAYRQYDRFEKCAHCELQPWCRGCPAVAAGTSGSFYAPDPLLEGSAIGRGTAHTEENANGKQRRTASPFPGKARFFLFYALTNRFTYTIINT